MKRLVGKMFALAILPCSLIALVASGAHAGNLLRFAVQYLNAEQSTNVAPADTSGVPTGGIAIYDLADLKVPANVNTLQVTISAAGDLNEAANSMWLACLVDGQPCNSSSNSAANSPAGWIPVLSLATGIATDNNIHYTWCMPISPNKGQPHPLRHTVQLRMASGDGADTVNIEQIHVLVDGVKIWTTMNACTAGAP
jgi:hypothetical protein